MKLGYMFRVIILFANAYHSALRPFNIMVGTTAQYSLPSASIDVFRFNVAAVNVGF
jgi:hypothetical protein